MIVISDEIYEKFVYDGWEHVSIGALPGMADADNHAERFFQDLCDDRLARGLYCRARLVYRGSGAFQASDEPCRADLFAVGRTCRAHGSANLHR